VRGALRGQLINGLITDEAMAIICWPQADLADSIFFLHIQHIN